MKKRLISLAMIIILVMCIFPSYALAGSLSNFTKIATYAEGQFTDVPAGQWYGKDLKTAYEYGLINGSSPTTYSPGNNMSLAEAIKIAACLHSMFNTGAADFAKGVVPWYQPYVDYAVTNGIITTSYPSYTSNATRADMAVIFASALPDEAITPINTINDNAIPDVAASYSYSPAVYKLYRAGILTGSGDTHMFKPNDPITRAEVAAIVARMASSSNRVYFSISSKELTPTEIAAKCSPAVFYIELYDSTGKILGSGSGFFINSSGLAVTNYHVIDGVSSAKIKTTDGHSYDVAGVYDYSQPNDLALIQINGSNFPYLNIGNSSSVVTGSAVHAIGYPLGIAQTFTNGSVSNPSLLMDGVNYIMMDASISHGSSGGALVNNYGEVVGVTCGAFENGQNLNLAIPISLIQSLRRDNYVPLSTVTAQNPKISVTASPSTVSLTVGAQAMITATASSDAFDSIAWMADDKTLISGSWGDWTGNSIPLIIKGLKAGTTTLYIGLFDANDKLLSETSVSVTVTGSGTATVYYAGYNVPDWGAFTGTPLYTKSVIPSGPTFYYRMSDVTVGTEVGLDQYYAALSSNGFSYSTNFRDSQGYVVLVYTNGVWDVCVGLANLNGVVCMAISIFTA